MKKKKSEEEMEEATTAASAGAFVAPLGYDPRFKKKKKMGRKRNGRSYYRCKFWTIRDTILFS